MRTHMVNIRSPKGALASKYLLKDLHGQLWRDSTARDKLVQRVCQSHSDPSAVNTRLIRQTAGTYDDPL